MISKNGRLSESAEMPDDDPQLPANSEARNARSERTPVVHNNKVL